MVVRVAVVETDHSRNCCKKVVEVWTAGGWLWGQREADSSRVLPVESWLGAME